VLALAELPTDTPQNPWRVAAEEAVARRDLRGTDTRVASIDPPGCVDVDDTLSVRRLPAEAPPPRRRSARGEQPQPPVACWEVRAPLTHM
jgi:hypothetical protein